jgi:hypothetical protein
MGVQIVTGSFDTVEIVLRYSAHEKVHPASLYSKTVRSYP